MWHTLPRGMRKNFSDCKCLLFAKGIRLRYKVTIRNYMQGVEAFGFIDKNKRVVTQGQNTWHIVAMLFIFRIVNYPNSPVRKMILHEKIIHEILHDQ